MSIKSQIQRRSLGTFLFMGAISVSIIWGILRIQGNEDLVNSNVEETLIFEQNIPAIRGNIYASDGTSLLATSVPFYYLGLDCKQASDKLFTESIEPLSRKLAAFFKDKSWQSYKEEITRKRRSKNQRYLRLISRRISHPEKEVIQTFPLFKDGKYTGGGSFETVPTRSQPFKNMAKRTIGSLDRKTKTRGLFGIEYSFNEYLAGENGRTLVQRLAGGVKLPLESEINKEAVAGKDVISTLDINFQDIVETALKDQVQKTNAKYGTAIVMEIETGEIKAITNLSRRSRNGKTIFVEDVNHAVLASTDPGSTFKLASMMAILEKSDLKLTDWAADCSGQIWHKGVSFTCDHNHGNITVEQVFEKSCNIGVYKLIERTFGMDGIDEYLTYIDNYHLSKPIGFQLKGEKNPYFKNSSDKTYSKTTLPWMSIGYESSISPIQMLAFYNAVANNGYWVEPFLVREIREGNTTIEPYYNTKISKAISSEKVVKMAQKMMKGVVERGTAKGIIDGYCQVAGKTGTAQKLIGSTYSKEASYSTSFLGFFPADNPKYSCAIVIDQPRGAKIYASQVSAPVFRTIADKIFAYDVNIHPVSNELTNNKRLARQQKSGLADDYYEIASELKLNSSPNLDGHVQLKIIKNDSLIWEPLKMNDELPDVSGMTLKDALPLLENKGFAVSHKGFGKVHEYALLKTGVVSLVLN